MMAHSRNEMRKLLDITVSFTVEKKQGDWHFIRISSLVIFFIDCHHSVAAVFVESL